MTRTKVDFSSVGWRSVESTNLITLYLRACESRSPRPILGDRAAAEAVDRIDYDFKRIHRAAQPWGNQFLVALRAKKLDDWAADFIRRHPDAVVLHLGCGLDTRAFRIDPPSTVQWFDLDQPGVTATQAQALRRHGRLPHDRLVGDRSRLVGPNTHRPADPGRRRRSSHVSHGA